MIEHKEPRKPYGSTLVNRYPHNIILIKQESDIVGQITVKDKFEEDLWLEIIPIINRLQKEKQS